MSSVEIIICIKDGKGPRDDQVIVQIGRKREFYRIPHSKYESTIDEIWKERLEANPKLFNTTKLRLNWLQFDQGVGSHTLEIRLTCYKDYLGNELFTTGKYFTFRTGEVGK